MIIRCTSELFAETADADRECESWYEKDYIVAGQCAVMIYPKPHWIPVNHLIIPIS